MSAKAAAFPFSFVQAMHTYDSTSTTCNATAFGAGACASIMGGVCIVVGYSLLASSRRTNEAFCVCASSSNDYPSVMKHLKIREMSSRGGTARWRSAGYHST